MNRRLTACMHPIHGPIIYPPQSQTGLPSIHWSCNRRQEPHAASKSYQAQAGFVIDRNSSSYGGCCSNWEPAMWQRLHTVGSTMIINGAANHTAVARIYMSRQINTQADSTRHSPPYRHLGVTSSQTVLSEGTEHSPVQRPDSAAATNLHHVSDSYTQSLRLPTSQQQRSG